MNQQQMMELLDKATDIKCAKCDSKLFEKVTILKQISRLIAPTNQDTIVPLEIYRCADCKEIPAEFNGATERIKD